jgi:hypothetical protein
MKKETILFVLVTLLFTSCFAPKQAAPAKQTYTFDYTTKTTVPLGSAGFVVGLIKPMYPVTFQASSSELFQSLRRGIGSDIEEVIIAKGFSLKGPYDALDEMIFEDKKRTDMLIQIEIAPSFTAVQGEWKSHYNPLLGGNYTYSYTGKASLVGRITLNGIEPLTNEKLWVKSVSIPNIENIDIATTNRYVRRLTDLEILEDPGVYNAIGKALQQQYQGILDKIVVQMSVEEFNSLKPQIKELKSKKGF